ncbi:hypothetical protein Pla175_04620 [Pirellulimonas nuda]|uniref:Dockerin domain-containing protein n=1 Tax=Pirellulimonas nuda TaxID=2528009 RepID=A0A518D6K2_9BACT|nr:hypothetical protein [Pirellulimonas nuda]QDU87107.1 hypothetical protein Pla175_04620 [Pirellulimonas nuda]
MKESIRSRFIAARLLGLVVLGGLVLGLGAGDCLAVTINPYQAVGPVVDRWAWDLKGAVGRTNTPAEAHALYGAVNANMVRIPIFAEAHFADGTVDQSKYNTLIDSINQIKLVNPNVQVFASLKLLGGDTFIGPASDPDWITQAGFGFSQQNGSIFGNTVIRPNPEHYAELVADYFDYMRTQGVEIDFVGLNNETQNALTSDRYISAYDRLNTKLDARGFDTDALKFIGSDSYGPNENISFLNALSSAGRLDTIDIVGSHQYSTVSGHTSDNWNTMSNISGGKEMWHTEVHMNPANSNNGSPPEDNITRMRKGMAVLFSANIEGVSSFTWWGDGQNQSNIDTTLKRELINSMIGGLPVETLSPDYPGNGSPDFNELDPDREATLYQAYKQGTKVTLWLANPGDAQNNLPVNLSIGKIRSGSLAGEYWSGPGNSVTGGNSGALAASLSADGLSFTIGSLPFNSIAMVTFDLLLGGDLNQDGQLNQLDIDQFLLGWRQRSPLGDLNNDLTTDRNDWFLLRTAFLEQGQAISAAGLGIAVPEPGALTTLLLVVATLRHRRPPASDGR